MAQRSCCRFGITTIELTVVLGIILVLVVVLFPVISVGPPNNHRARVATMANQLQTAAMAYETEYGHYPVPRGTGPKDVYYSSTDTAGWAALTIALCSLDPAHPDVKVDTSITTIPNDRSITFLTLKLSDCDVSSGTGIARQPYPDSHGNVQFFFMALDSDGDGKLGEKGQPAGKLPDFAKGELTGGKTTDGVAVWSNCDQDLNDP